MCDVMCHARTFSKSGRFKQCTHPQKSHSFRQNSFLQVGHSLRAHKISPITMLPWPAGWESAWTKRRAEPRSWWPCDFSQAVCLQPAAIIRHCPPSLNHHSPLIILNHHLTIIHAYELIMIIYWSFVTMDWPSRNSNISIQHHSSLSIINYPLLNHLFPINS